jgi:DNA repair exonuclease SbcCD ATPase subunit
MTSAVIEKKQVNGGAVLSVTTGLTKANELNLKRMVDLALNSQPKLGIVNFNMLKTFLLELLKALNLQNHEIKFADGDVETKTVVENALQSESQLAGDEIGGSGGGNGVTDNSNLNTPKLGEHAKGISILTSDMKPFTLERFHNLEDKLARFEQQIAALNSLPSNQHIIDQSKELKKSTSDSKHGPIMEVWQYTQLSKRLEANEEGLTKLTSLLQDLIGDINELKDDQSKNSADIKRLNDLVNSLKDRFGEFEKLKNSLPSLDQLKSLENDIEALRKNLVFSLGFIFIFYILVFKQIKF